MMHCTTGLVAAVMLAAVAMRGADAFYLPGVAPHAFKDGDAVNLKVQTLISTETPLQFDYYQLPFCAPDKILDIPENLGEALAGEKAHTSAYQAFMKKDEFCKTLCKKHYTPQQMEEFQDFTILDYRVNMRLDNLPVAEINLVAFEDKPDETIKLYNLGYPIGSKVFDRDAPGGTPEVYQINNHLRFKILYHPLDSSSVETEDAGSSTGSYIVGFQVAPYSIHHVVRGKWNESTPYNTLATCSKEKEAHDGADIVWTYDVVWERSDVKWASRWDVYLTLGQASDDKIHWFSIVNSLVILMFLSGIVALIMTRILRKDFARYNEVAATEEERAEAAREMREETGWKLVYGDVFRPPPGADLLAVYAGSGAQLLVMTALTLAFAALGFLSPSNRGALLSAVLFFFVLMGAPAGYVAARFCRMVREPDHLRTTVLTATLFPGACFAMFFVLNLVAWARQSSTAVPFGTLVVVMLLWFGVSLPLIFAGAFVGFRQDPIAFPCKTNPIPRQIPPQVWYLRLPVSLLIGGLLPFGAVFVEMFFILSSLWLHRFYYMFGFLALVFVILLLTSAEIAIVLCYLHLCAEDYRWWWRSFLTSGAVAPYVFLYSAYNYFSRAHPAAHFDLLSCSLYFGYTAILSYAVFVLAGFVGFASCFAFVVKIYGSIKID
eukprot:CAMPEP_0113676420 /NCGR_PEP_ID=MMETSP0038_2-20120614/8633_1 /TAXON_ID=2898 /ORGANISM="Cryptomonas paramecium" /LENGTH=661 /DNA_ID=CAMNT_0000593447 /DNA_START=3 /DNA_END=1988 /DNA_ORIENTATION=- /assembly_acc=CAM_ASM_000170